MIKTIMTALASGENVEINSFGKFVHVNGRRHVGRFRREDVDNEPHTIGRYMSDGILRRVRLSKYRRAEV
jgi:hypothetical protein